MICPIHNKEMRQNSRGWFCSAKDPNGHNGYCDYKPDSEASDELAAAPKASTRRAPGKPASSIFKTPKGTELPLLQLQGKPYLQVAHRLVWFREEHPTWTIEPEQLTIDETHAIFMARIKDETGRLIASATKHETQAGFADFIEKAETGAVGRALALCGYGTQFAPELEEGERIVDSPITPAKPADVQRFEESLPDTKATPAPKDELQEKLKKWRKAPPKAPKKTTTADEAFTDTEPPTPDDEEAAASLAI